MSSPDPRIELYLDGLLHGEELAAFEQSLAASPELGAAIEQQHGIDAELRAAFAYEPSRAAADPARPAAPVAGRIGPAGKGGSGQAARLRFYGVAAAVLLGGAATFSYIMRERDRIDRFITPAEVYAIVDKPEFVCETDEQFAAAVKDRLGQPLVLAAAPGIEALGWAYGSDYLGLIVGEKTMVLINRVHGEKVLVFMDRKRADRALVEPPADSGLKLFRRQVGSIVLYEVTPLDRPEVLDRLNPPR